MKMNFRFHWAELAAAEENHNYTELEILFLKFYFPIVTFLKNFKNVTKILKKWEIVKQNQKTWKKLNASFFNRVRTSVQNLTPSMIFLYDELHIILKPTNLKICEHSIFIQLLNKNRFNGTLEIRFLSILIGVEKNLNCSSNF